MCSDCKNQFSTSRNWRLVTWKPEKSLVSTRNKSDDVTRTRPRGFPSSIKHDPADKGQRKSQYFSSVTIEIVKRCANLSSWLFTMLYEVLARYRQHTVMDSDSAPEWRGEYASQIPVLNSSKIFHCRCNGRTAKKHALRNSNRIAIWLDGCW